MNPMHAVTEAVATLQADLPGLLDACTNPQALDVAELLLVIREARETLQGVERDAEAALGKAMLGDQAMSPTLRVERRRTADRTAWDHEGWQRDVRAKALQAAHLKGAQGVLTADGEVLPASVLHDLLRTVEAAHGAAAPKVTALRSLGLDPQDYCETSPGGIKVTVYRIAEEGGEDDAA